MATMRGMIARATPVQLVLGTLVTLVLVVTISITVGQTLERNRGTVEPRTTGRGLQAPAEILAAFGDATALGDYSTGVDLMAQGNPWMTDIWRSETERQVQAGHIQTFTQIRKIEQRGQTTVALLEWAGNEEPWCLQVSLDTESKVTPLSSYGHCTTLEQAGR